MLYSDSEIYGSIRRGVDKEVLAQLNSCHIDEIEEAYDRYQAYLDHRNGWYDEQMTRKGSSSPKTNKKECIMNEKKKRVRFEYSERIVKLIKSKLDLGLSVPETYEIVFKDIPNSERPTLQSFRQHCREIKNPESKHKPNSSKKSISAKAKDPLREELKRDLKEIMSIQLSLNSKIAAFQIKIFNALSSK